MNDDLISRQAAIDAVSHHGEIENDYTDLYHDGYCDGVYDSVDILEDLPSAQPERVWTPCDIPPEHHRDVIVRGVEAIGGQCVYKVMQWDVDKWRPTDYAPSIMWLDWSEI